MAEKLPEGRSALPTRGKKKKEKKREKKNRPGIQDGILAGAVSKPTFPVQGRRGLFVFETRIVSRRHARRAKLPVEQGEGIDLPTEACRSLISPRRAVVLVMVRRHQGERRLSSHSGVASLTAVGWRTHGVIGWELLGDVFLLPCRWFPPPWCLSNYSVTYTAEMR